MDQFENMNVQPGMRPVASELPSTAGKSEVRHGVWQAGVLLLAGLIVGATSQLAASASPWAAPSSPSLSVRDSVSIRIGALAHKGVDICRTMWRPTMIYLFPYLHSTRLYPEWPLAKLPGTTEELSRELSVALLSMPSGSPAALAAQSGGWTVCLNYTSVHDWLRELRMPPYEQYGHFGWSAMWQQYWPWLLSITALIIALLGALLLLRGKQRAVVRVSSQNHLLLASAGEGICGIDLHGITTFVNPAAAVIPGYTTAELDGSGCLPFASDAIREIFRVNPEEVREDASKLFANLHPDDAAGVFASIQASAQDLSPWQHEFRVKYDDGTILALYGDAVPQREEDESVLWHGFVTDITERKRAENELQWKTAFLEAQINASLDGILVINSQNKRLLSNQRLFDQWNVPQHIRDDSDDAALLNYVVSLTKYPEQFYEKVRYLYDRPDATSRDEIEFKNGMVLDRYSSPVLGQDGHYYGRIWTFRDITERRQADEALRESKQRLEIAIEGAEMGEWYWDAVEDKRYFSDQTCSLLGINPATFRGTADEFFAGMPPEDREAVKAALCRTLDQDQPYESEYRTVWPDGSVHFITARGKLLRDYAGNPLKLSGIIWDVTSQKQTENNLRRTVAALAAANKALEESNQIAESATRAKSEFLANMSHEIRTPITAILGYADIISEENIGSVTCESAEVIKRNGEHLLGLINNILDLSKVEAGKMQIEPTRCSPLQVAVEVVSLMRVRAEAKHLQLEMDLADPLPETVCTDPLRLRQILVNLVGNAIKFTDQGEVCLAVRLTSDGGRPRLRFDVTDTGIGMNEEQISRLFRAFSQVDNSAARKFSGSGLGLAISKQLTEAMGGRIDVRSVPGKGSTFSVTIDPGPLEGIRMIQNAQEAVLAPTTTTSAATENKIGLHGRVLLAEDGPDNQRLVAFLLKKAGAVVTVVENGQLAVKAAVAAREAGQPFDVILMDMQMPVMDGYEATRALRAQGYTGPIVALTAHAMAEDRQKCIDAGCDDFATKPIDRQKLLAMVARWATQTASEHASDHSPPL